MSLLIATVANRGQLNSVKRLIEVYFVINQIKYYDADITLLAYYCLFGASKRTNLLIKEAYYGDKSPERATHAIYQIRSKLAKLGVLVRDPYTLELGVKPDLARVFEETHKLGALLNFTFDEELETDPATTGQGVQPSLKGSGGTY